jgi:orotate phosphoribosyltransferase
MVDLAAARKRLLALLKERSWRRGPVVLASGRTSDFYLDCKQTALSAEGAQLIGALVFDHVRALRKQGLRIDGVGGLTLGADPIAVATAVTSQLASEPVQAFIIRKEPKGHGTGAWMEGSASLPEGSHVLIVEDVVTTGGSSRKAIERSALSGLTPVALICLVDREEGGRDALADTKLPMTSLFTRSDFFAEP